MFTMQRSQSQLPKVNTFYVHIQTFIGNILVSVNPYKMHDIYGLDAVKRYESQVLGLNPP